MATDSVGVLWRDGRVGDGVCLQQRAKRARENTACQWMDPFHSFGDYTFDSYKLPSPINDNVTTSYGSALELPESASGKATRYFERSILKRPQSNEAAKGYCRTRTAIRSTLSFSMRVLRDGK
ncbi:uncharacterized protein PpBr36_10588 [Pyricularia pennisetigena]|uniref:uncharacterized protein n=1 Tax=Pyricularia pennisetigena TaxID=1578925 RepID=UPI001152EC83|nr:uncharacterized protein PpBr36_10588 [Pyricularia pennisetigena]TLS21279.1 hypothetical protein PpBr36_10588 [Pyricularia pennisetigena]